MIEQAISDLLTYAKLHLHLSPGDLVYCSNVVSERLGLTSFAFQKVDEKEISALTCPDCVIAPIVSYALEQGICEEGEEEFFSSEILDLLSPKPSQTNEAFRVLYEKDAKSAFDYLYDLGVKNDYVKKSAIEKNKIWTAEKTKNKIEITINLSKPEKNNKQTALLKNAPTGYPKCMLCEENVGYIGQGRTRRNMRVVPVKLAGEDWFWQFSPYAYFYQHGIAVNKTHTPMVLNEKTFEKLLDFVDVAPHYFIGSNAPLPIVGGSILAHEHFQGGAHVFPMFKTKTRTSLVSQNKEITATIPDWYNSVILLESENKSALVKEGGKILEKWLSYSDESVGIYARTDAPHNTIAPITRKNGEKYQLYLLLRNNRCDEKHPDGIFHAHSEYHNIKSESIGLIEAMGRFILPGRLLKQLAEVENVLTGEAKELSENAKIHQAMTDELLKKTSGRLSKEQAHQTVIDRIEKTCEHILENTAVFKDDDEGRSAFLRFLSACGYQEK